MKPLCCWFHWLCCWNLSVQFWAPQYKSGVKVLQKSQRKATRMVKRLEGISCEERVRMLGCPRLEKRRLKSDFVAPCSTLRSEAEGAASLFSLELMAKCMGTCQGRVWQSIRKHLFAVKVDRHWNRLERWLMPHTCHCWRAIYTMPSSTDFLLALNRSGRWTRSL